MCKNSLSALGHTSGCTVWKNLKCKRLCGDRRDNIAVEADTQTGSSASINESMEDMPILTFFHMNTPSLWCTSSACTLLCVQPHPPPSPTTLTQPWAGEQTFFSFLLINQWNAREGELSRRWGVSLNKRCWWWSGCCIIRASEHLSSPHRAYVINCAKLENDIGAE